MSDVAGAIRRRAAVFIDIENMFGGYGSPAKVGGVPLRKIFDDVLALLACYGCDGYALARMYANWGASGMRSYNLECRRLGITPVHLLPVAFSRDDALNKTKNGADIEFAVDALSVAYERPEIEVFVLVAHDGDYIPLVNRLHSLGKTVLAVTLAHRPRNAQLAYVVDKSHIVGTEITRDNSDPMGMREAAAERTDTEPVDQIPTRLEVEVTAAQTLAGRGSGPDPASSTTDAVKGGRSNDAEPGPTPAHLRRWVRNLLLSSPAATGADGTPDLPWIRAQVAARWPRYSTTGPGSKNLATLIDDVIGRNEQALPTVSPEPRGNLQSFTAAVRRAVGGLDWERMAANGRPVPVSAFLKSLSAEPDYVGRAQSGFRTSEQALSFALATTPYQVIQTGPGEYGVAPRALALTDALDDLTDDDLPRLAAANPPRALKPLYVMPDPPEVLPIVASWLADTRSGGTVDTDLTDEGADFLSHLDPTAIRTALRLLLMTGVLVGEKGVRTGEGVAVLASDLRDASAIVGAVRVAIAQRLAEVGWPSDESLVAEIVPDSS